jgi:hypothetical protein
MRRDRAERVLAEQARLDLDAGETVAVGGEAGDLLVAQAGADRQAFERLALLEQLAEAALVLGLYLDEFAERLVRLVEVLDLRRGDLQRTTPLRSSMTPRLGGIGTSEMRLSSARVV